MTPFKFGADNITLPSGWNELTVLHLQKVSALPENEKTNFCKLLEIFTGIPYKTWFDAELSELNVAQLTSALAWAQSPIDMNILPMPDSIFIGAKKIDIPKNLAVKTLGQKQRFEQVALPALESNKSLVGSMAELLAIYMQPLYTGEKFNTDTIDDVIRLCEQCKAVEAFPVVSFFLKKYFVSGRKTQRSNIRETPSMKKQRRDSSKTSAN
jgi:hypothetical protein